MVATHMSHESEKTVIPTTRKVAKKPSYVGFGAIDEFGAHIFKVTVPQSSKGDVVIIEDYGLKGGDNGIPLTSERVSLPRRFWTAISEASRKDFSARLKSKKLSGSRWRAGDNLVDRMLGKELCVLAWAVEHASSVDEARAIAARWAAFRPEERWWLFSQVVAESGDAEDTDRGWRKALYYAMSEGVVGSQTKKPKRPDDTESSTNLDLF